jgi:hypothetical protein
MQPLTSLLNLIEQQGVWPSVLAAGKAAILHKTEIATPTRMHLCILVIPPTLYRRWMSCRLKSHKKWVNEWALGEMFAGVAGRGADNGWCLCSLHLEFLRAQHADYTGGAADMDKCFDQVNRLIIYTLLDMAGLPDRISKPYMSCTDNRTISIVLQDTQLSATSTQLAPHRDVRFLC